MNNIRQGNLWRFSQHENSKRQLLVAPSKTWTVAGKVTGKLWPLTNGHNFLMGFFLRWDFEKTIT